MIYTYLKILHYGTNVGYVKSCIINVYSNNQRLTALECQYFKRMSTVRQFHDPKKSYIEP